MTEPAAVQTLESARAALNARVPPPGTLLSAPVGEIALAMGGSTLKPAIFTGTALFMMRDVLPFMDGRR